MRVSICALVVVAAAAGACSSLPNPMARAQEAAQELNVNLRYGRSEVVLESVAPAARDEFTAHHRDWGSKVRIADLELEAFHPKGDRDAEVTVRVSWYRPDQGDLRSTTVKQSWRNDGGWKLVAESRVDGDAGLLGEPIVVQAPEDAKSTPQFPTVRLGGGSP